MSYGKCSSKREKNTKNPCRKLLYNKILTKNILLLISGLLIP